MTETSTVTESGFVQIHPSIEHQAPCPVCETQMSADGWRIPGMWTLAALSCPTCGRHFLCDLPYGVGALAPCFLEPETGTVRRPGGAQWYADLTAQAWQDRSPQTTELQVQVRRPARNACLINCLIPWWGDAVSLLLRINQLARYTHLDLVVLIPANLLWLVPDYVAEVWVYPGGLAATKCWSEGLAEQLQTLVRRFETCCVPRIFQPAHLSQTELESFTSVPPFPRREWLERLAVRPTITFMWRTDRNWSIKTDAESTFLTRMPRFGRLVNRYRSRRAQVEQLCNVIALAEDLRRYLPRLDFAVCGLGRLGQLPGWIEDLRVETMSEETNRDWCRRSSESHVLLGVLGSHMVLPSGHAGAVVELVPRSFLPNVLTELLVTCEDERESLYCYRWLPLETAPITLSAIVQSILYNYPYMHKAFHRDYYRPLTRNEVTEIATLQSTRSTILKKQAVLSVDHLLGP